jgi:hypothetical protein
MTISFLREENTRLFFNNSNFLARTRCWGCLPHFCLITYDVLSLEFCQHLSLSLSLALSLSPYYIGPGDRPGSTIWHDVTSTKITSTLLGEREKKVSDIVFTEMIPYRHMYEELKNTQATWTSVSLHRNLCTLSHLFIFISLHYVTSPLSI